ncbi:hypothetical protein CEXT_532321 [Caerostris extrusa]|uniref:Uncharacterized protein n=1 Tax=Caerostris extrusa TaxID=172846 RepID=A0AAV4SVZ8_CAEEX|nr:hypothetical protein CEXT_532321 [Caerostris extrusa]
MNEMIEYWFGNCFNSIFHEAVKTPLGKTQKKERKRKCRVLLEKAKEEEDLKEYLCERNQEQTLNNRRRKQLSSLFPVWGSHGVKRLCSAGHWNLGVRVPDWKKIYSAM